MLTKILIVFVLLLIIGSLAVALRYLLFAGGERSTRTVKALTWRIGLSIVLFFLLLLGYQAGVLQPHGLNTGKAQPPTGGAAK